MSEKLTDKSLTQLRVMAQAMDIQINFADDKPKLLAKIEAAVLASIPKPPSLIPAFPYRKDNLPAERFSGHDAMEAMRPFIEQGLRFETYPDNTWLMRYGLKHDSGNIRMPRRILRECAKAVMHVEHTPDIRRKPKGRDQENGDLR